LKLNKKNTSTKEWRVNEQITAPEVRVVGTNEDHSGVMPISEALELAKKEGLDLIEIAGRVSPPVVKIADYGKFRYAQEKKLKEQKKKAKTSELKEVRFSPFIAKKDYTTRLKRVKEFLNDNHKVRTAVVFKGRHMDSKKFGYRLLERILGDLQAETEKAISIDMDPKFAGRHLAMVISQSKSKNTNKNAETKDKEISI
jgi:translation initiation factor IF-3